MIPLIIGMSVLFVALAVLNWTKEIGAGPTILIVGSLFLTAYIGVSYSSYLYDIRVYDNCVERSERFMHEYAFHEKVVSVLSNDLNANQSSVDELNALLIKPLPTSICGPEPDFPT